MEDEEESVADKGTKVECVKVAMRQSKDGHILTLSIHPNDMPEELFRDPVGQRYVAVLVRVNDQDEPVAAKETAAAIAMVKSSVMLAQDPRFQLWLVTSDMAEEASEEQAVNAIRRHCQIASRKELRVNKAAQKRFLDLRDWFQADLRR